MSWTPLTKESAAATQAMLEALLGLNRRTFNASAYLAQGNSAAFTEAPPGERKAILGEILDPAGLWPGWAERAGRERKQAEAELAACQARIAERAPAIERLPDFYRAADKAKIAQEQARENHRQTEETLEAARQALAANEAAAERLKVAEQAHAAASREQIKARDALDGTERDADQLAGAQAALATLEQRAAEIPSLEAQEHEQREAEQARQEAMRARQAADMLAEEKARAWRTAAGTATALSAKEGDIRRRILDLRHAEAGAEVCTLCHQHLGEEARATTIRNLEAEAAALNKEAAAAHGLARRAEEEREQAEEAARAISIPDASYDSALAQKLVSARQAAQERAGLVVRLESYEAAAAELPERRQALAAAERALFDAGAALELAQAATVDPAALAEKAERARRELANRRVDLEEAAAEVARAEQQVAAARQAAAELAALRGEAAALNLRLDVLRLAERACGRDGIPALIAENAAGAIEAEANRILERLPTESGTCFRVELRTQRALKSDAAALRETLDILVSDRQGTREFLTFSGGERFRVSFALRWALARLLAGRRGAESRLLVIDEPDGLDAGGMDGLAALLRDEAKVFSRVLVVSHNPLLASAFEQVLEVQSDGEASRLALPEAAAHA